jgi:hypothetical protein
MNQEQTTASTQQGKSINKNNVSIRELFELIKLYLFGTTSSKFMAIGLTFLMLGIPTILDYSLYAFEIISHATANKPSSSFEWPQYFGLIIFLVGVLIKFKVYRDDNNRKLREEKTHFKENYQNLTDVRLQDEFERLYGIRASVTAIKNLLSHPDDKNAVLDLFENAHKNVIPCGDWFKDKGQYMKLRHSIGFIFWAGLPILGIMVFIMGGLEYIRPGITKSGPYAIYAYVVLFICIVASAILLFKDLRSLGHAIKLVNEHKPLSRV